MSKRSNIPVTILHDLFHAMLIIICSMSCGPFSSERVVTEKEQVNYDSAIAIPDFNIFTLPDSLSFSSQDLPNKGIVMIKYFSPDCDHCQEEARTYFSKKDSLKNVKTIWVSGDWASLVDIKEFTETYQVDQVDPIAIGKETTNDLLAFYGLSGIPYAAVYKDDQLIKEYRGAMDFDELISINDGTYKPVSITSELNEEVTSEE